MDAFKLYNLKKFLAAVMGEYAEADARERFLTDTANDPELRGISRDYTYHGFTRNICGVNVIYNGTVHMYRKSEYVNRHAWIDPLTLVDPELRKRKHVYTAWSQGDVYVTEEQAETLSAKLADAVQIYNECGVIYF